MTSQLRTRIFAVLGLTAVAQAPACPGLTSDGCEDHDVEPVPGCTVPLDAEESLDEECVFVEPIDGACPSVDVINEGGNLASGAAVCEPIPASGSDPATGGAPPGSVECCYWVVSPEGCVGGRPFLVEGVARTARAGSTGTGWQRKAPATRLGSNLPEAARRRIAADWLADGYMEHASVGAFAKFALELLALGAPFELVRDAQAAMADEVLHARRCFDLALQYGHSNVVLGPLDFGVIRADGTLASVMRSAILEGCIGETLAATMTAHASAAASEPAARAALAEIARDEGRHCELAWRFRGLGACARSQPRSACDLHLRSSAPRPLSRGRRAERA